MFTTNLQDSQLQKLNEVIKILKSDFIYVTKSGLVYGFNKDFTLIRESNITVQNIPECIFRTLDFNAFMKAKVENIWMKSGCKSEMIPFSFGIKPQPDFLYSGMYLKDSLDAMIYNKNNILEHGLVDFAHTRFNDDPEFKNVYDGPSDKGAMLLPSYGIYIYKGMIPLGAKDQLELVLLAYGNYKMGVFSVYKPKGIVIHTYVNYLNIDTRE